MKLRIVIVVAVIALLGAGIWLSFPWLQLKRADMALDGANGHITQANSLISEADVEGLASAGFTSIDNINRAAQAVAAARPLLEESQHEIGQAAAEAGDAAGYSKLPSWYGSYLSQKQQVAQLRSAQISNLMTLLDRLGPLYGNGAAVFQSEQQLDQLMGQFQAATAKIQSSPSAAGAELDQVAAQYRSLEAQLKTAYTGSGSFDLLDSLSLLAGNQAGLAELSSQMAAAAERNDQAAAQQTAQLIQSKMDEMSANQAGPDDWQQSQITPLLDEFNSLQSQEEELDRQAAELYAQNR